MAIPLGATTTTRDEDVNCRQIVKMNSHTIKYQSRSCKSRVGCEVVRCERKLQRSAKGSFGSGSEGTTNIDFGARNLSVHRSEGGAEKRHVRDLINGKILGKILGFRAEKRLLSTFRTGSAAAQCPVEAVTKRSIGVELSLEALCTQEDVARIGIIFLC